jgi:hypothetical protein
LLLLSRLHSVCACVCVCVWSCRSAHARM